MTHGLSYLRCMLWKTIIEGIFLFYTMLSSERYVNKSWSAHFEHINSISKKVDTLTLLFCEVVLQKTRARTALEYMWPDGVFIKKDFRKGVTTIDKQSAQIRTHFETNLCRNKSKAFTYFFFFATVSTLSNFTFFSRFLHWMQSLFYISKSINIII